VFVDPCSKFFRYFYVLVILLCGGSKKTQDKDIQRAKDLWNEYKERIG
jgi:putative component of toxin-antitoxin plasmid stabilization module